MATAPKSLYRLTDEVLEIEAELLAVYEDIEDNGGELTDELEARLDAANARLDQVAGTREAKMDAIVAVYRNAVMWQERIEKEMAALKSRARVKENMATRLKSYLLAEMQRHGDTRIETALCELRRTRNSQPSVRLIGDVVPDWCARIVPEKRELDVKTVLAELKASDALPTVPSANEVEIAGVKFAVTLGEHLRIR